MRELFAYVRLLFSFSRSLWRIEHQHDNRPTTAKVNDHR